MKAIWEELEERIRKEYHIEAPEWVQVDVSNRGKIHVTVVTDNNVPREEIRTAMEAAIQETEENYRIGFIDVYSVEKAKELHVEKQIKAKGYSSWADALYANEDIKDENTDMQIISFYSYKGGVGRTIALIETAYNLARQGKRVLLLDLDIEAPSLHNIFADKVNDALEGVEYGIIEYLYRKVVQGSTDVSIDDIYCSLQLENVPGEMFLIPALKNMDKEYIYQIGRLQTRKIQEQDIFQEVFAYAQKMLGVDVIMIDTRAGFNQWGSLSLLSLSNQIIFIAYPNRENMEGLRAAFEMVGNVGKKRYAVAMSKVVASAEGEEKARKLFGHLEISQKELIPVYYREEIALSDRYPIVSENIVNAYQELSDYILNNEKIERNKRFLADGEKERLLGQLFVPESRPMRLFDTYKFKRQRFIMIAKYRHEEELSGLDTGIEQYYTREDDKTASVQVCTLAEPDMDTYYAVMLSKDAANFAQLGMELLTETIKKSSVKDRIILPEKTGSMEEFIAALQYKETKEKAADRYGMETRFHNSLRIAVFIRITQEMLAENAEKVVENMNGLLQVFNKDTDKIQFKFLIENKIWDLHQKLFGAVRGNVMELRVSRDDLERYIIWNINHKAFAKYRDYIRNSQTEERMMYKIDGQFIPEGEVMETLGLVLGIRKEVKEYSSSMIEYLYQFLQEKPELLYTEILECLKRAAGQELKKTDDRYDDRLIGFSYIQRELSKLPI